MLSLFLSFSSSLWCRPSGLPVNCSCTHRQTDRYIYFLKAIMITTSFFLLFLYSWMHINENSKVVLPTVTVIAAVMVIEKKNNPILPLYKKKNSLSLIVVFVVVVKQEVRISSAFLDMSFELDTYSLRDVIVIICVRETLSLTSITENKCSIIALTIKRRRHAH